MIAWVLGLAATIPLAGAAELSELIAAVEADDKRAIVRLLDAGLDPDAPYLWVEPDAVGLWGGLGQLLGGREKFVTTATQRALDPALAGRRTSALALLLARGGDPNLATTDRAPPLFRVAEASGRTELRALVDLLVEHGGDLTLLHEGRSAWGALATERIAAPGSRSRAFVDHLLARGAPVQRGLCDAASRGDAWLVDRLRSAGATVDACPDGSSPLVRAIAGGHAPLANHLLDVGAPASPAGLAALQTTPLHQAVHAGSVSLIERLIAAGSDLEALERSESGARTPLAASLAATPPSREVVAALVAAGARRDAVVGESGTVFHAGAAAGLLGVLMARPLDDGELAAAVAASAAGLEVGLAEPWPAEAVRASVEALGLSTWSALFSAAGPTEVRRALEGHGPTRRPALPSGCPASRRFRGSELLSRLGEPTERARDGITRTWTFEVGEARLVRYNLLGARTLATLVDAPPRCDADGASLRGLSRPAVRLAVGVPDRSTASEDLWQIDEGRVYVVTYDQEDRAVHTSWDFRVQ